MKIYKTTPWYIKFDESILYKMCDYAVANGFDTTDSPFIEDGIDKYFNVELDYDEKNKLYVIYFKTDNERTLFQLRYSECL